MRLDDEAELARALGDTLLRDRPIQRLFNYRSSEFAFRSAPVEDGNYSFLVGCEPDEIEAAYLAARSAVDRTGRWPVATAGWWAGKPLAEELDEGRIWPLGDLLPPLSDVELEARVQARWEELDSYRFDDHWTELRHHVAMTEERVGSAPAEDQIRSALGDDPGELTLDRWLFDWEQQHEARIAEEPDRGGHRDGWFVPVGQPCGIVLTPTATPWLAAGLLDFYGTETRADTPFLFALLRRWSLRWGAEVVASFGTMLEFVVERPPTEPSDLIGLAVEHYAMAPCTLQLPGISVRDYARDLRGSDSWFLHERP
jgi:hypothetical protein